MKRFSILDYGAQSGTDELQTEAIQTCIDACFLAGGGVVEIPQGDYRTGGLRLRSGVTLHLLENAHLLGSRNPEDYGAFLTDTLEPVADDDRTDAAWSPATERIDKRFFVKCASRWNNALIRAIDARNLAIIGEPGAYIDGCDCFDEQGEEHYRGPHGINFHRCENIVFRNYEIRNTANWAHALFDCRNVVMQNVHAVAGHDGIHITGCDNVTIEDCVFETGDDCIAGIDNINVTARRCELNTACSGLRFGGTNALFKKCHFYGPAKYLFRGSLTPEEKRSGKPAGGSHRYNMLSLMTYYADFMRDIRMEPGNIVIRDCTAENVDRFLHYNFSGNEPWQRNRPLSSLVFDRVRATGVRLPLTAYGSEEQPFSLTLRDVSVEFAENARAPFMHLAYWDAVRMTRVRIRGVKAPVLIKAWSDGRSVELADCDLGGYAGETFARTDEPFVCTPI